MFVLRATAILIPAFTVYLFLFNPSGTWLRNIQITSCAFSTQGANCVLPFVSNARAVSLTRVKSGLPEEEQIAASPIVPLV